jgi:hypothetical protein
MRVFRSLADTGYLDHEQVQRAAEQLSATLNLTKIMSIVILISISVVVVTYFVNCDADKAAKPE